MTWVDEAACNRTDVCMWPTPPLGPTTTPQAAAYRTAVTAAQTICSTCTVRPACLVDAIHHGDIGIRGGLTEPERAMWLTPAGSPMAVWADQAHRRGVA